VLAGDIGGTKTHLGLYRLEGWIAGFAARQALRDARFSKFSKMAAASAFPRDVRNN
jgi:hypothetical protein